ncbi:MAG: hypothetical protein PHH08_02265 [Candidatus ainarchaeum sp.]|nr:hypothetical protein [Candidatus ainarchaeum sp.]
MPRPKKKQDSESGLKFIENPQDSGAGQRLALHISPERVKALLEEIKVPSLKALKEK